MSRPTTPLHTTAPSLSTRPPKDPSPSTFTAPPRSSTHPIKPRHHIPHHPHRVHHHHHHHRHDSNVPQSAIQPTLSLPFGDLLAKTTSSRDEAADNTLAREKEERERQKQKLEQETQERAQWAQVEKMRAKRTAADEELKTTLSTLSTLSTSTTRRLDYTYYSLLSSLSTLTTTISSLHTLSRSASSLSTHFSTDSAALDTEITTQVEANDRGFKQQATRIENLEARMRTGREKVRVLGERLEGVRVRVEREAERDREGRRRVGRRLRMLWGVMGIWGILILVGILVRHWPDLGGDVRDMGEVALGVGSGREEVGLRQPLGERDGGRKKGGGELVSITEENVNASETPDTHPVLRLFDEL